MKTCEMCYWESICKKGKKEICSDYSAECGCGNGAKYNFRNVVELCEECMLERLGIEVHEVRYFYDDGEYVGNECDEELEEILSNYKGVELIDDL